MLEWGPIGDARKDGPVSSKEHKQKKAAKKKATAKASQAKAAVALEGRACPCCKKHCPLAKPKCGKGKAVRAKMLGDAKKR